MVTRMTAVPKTVGRSTQEILFLRGSQQVLQMIAFGGKEKKLKGTSSFLVVVGAIESAGACVAIMENRIGILCFFSFIHPSEYEC